MLRHIPPYIFLAANLKLLFHAFFDTVILCYGPAHLLLLDHMMLLLLLPTCLVHILGVLTAGWIQHRLDTAQAGYSTGWIQHSLDTAQAGYRLPSLVCV
jgi:hypothetical protein